MSEKKLALIATKGTLDWAYPPFILASTAAAIGYETQIFFTFYGLQLLKKDLDLKVSPLGNPGMPMPMGMDKWFPTIGTAIPGMEAMMTSMMKSKMKSKGVASVADLREMCLEADVKMIACQMTVDLFDMQPRQPPFSNLPGNQTSTCLSSNNYFNNTKRTRGGSNDEGST
jgi:peroxiredoxin family protein